MGADLLTLYAAASSDKVWSNIDWEAAKKCIADADEEILRDAASDLMGWHGAEDGEPEEEGESIDDIRKAALEGLDLWKEAWGGGAFRFSNMFTLTNGSMVLVVGGISWGDEPFEGFNQMHLATQLGALDAAGFDQ